MIMNTFGGRKGNVNDPPNKNRKRTYGKNYRFKKWRCFTFFACPIATKANISKNSAISPKNTPPGNKYNFAFLKRRKGCC